MVKGIDVSVWQGYNVDFNKIKSAGYDFVILRAGYGRYFNQKDPTFEGNYKKAKEACLEVGAYWYSYATNSSQAQEEAKIFLDAVKGKTFEYPLWLDIEDSSQASLNNKTINAICRSFCDTLEKAGYYTGIYSYASFLSRLDDSNRKAYDIWVAHFGVEKPGYSGDYGMWQFSERGSVNGISGNVDLDYSYKDYPKIMKSNGLNGFTKVPTPVETKPATSTQEKPKEESKPVTITYNYTIKYGDTLIGIAKKYGVTVPDIAKENNIRNVNLIYAGQKIKITKKIKN